MAKKSTTARPPRGVSLPPPALDRALAAIARIDDGAKAAEGIAHALVAIYAPILRDSEDQAQRLGSQCGTDAGARYSAALVRTQELRMLVALAETMRARLGESLSSVRRVSETVRCLARQKGGAQ